MLLMLGSVDPVLCGSLIGVATVYVVVQKDIHYRGLMLHLLSTPAKFNTLVNNINTLKNA